MARLLPIKKTTSSRCSRGDYPRLLGRKSELLEVLDHPDIPLHTDASENALRAFVTKRKTSGDTMSRDGRVARHVMLGLMKTCQKLGLSFYHYIGDRLGIGSLDQPVSSLPAIILGRT